MNRLHAYFKTIRNARYRAGVWFHTLQARKACYRADCIINAVREGGSVAHGVAVSKRWLFPGGES